MGVGQSFTGESCQEIIIEGTFLAPHFFFYTYTCHHSLDTKTSPPFCTPYELLTTLYQSSLPSRAWERGVFARGFDVEPTMVGHSQANLAAFVKVTSLARNEFDPPSYGS